jgi:hypothetical protein
MATSDKSLKSAEKRAFTAMSSLNSQRKRRRISRLPRTPIKRRIPQSTVPPLQPDVDAGHDTEPCAAGINCNRIDEINWDISKEQVEESKARLVPSYWQSLQGEAYGVMMLSSRLYIVQDWNIRFSYLTVEPMQQSCSNVFRNGSTDMFL